MLYRGVELPDILADAEGKRIQNASDWQQRRRGELLELFRKHVYGRAPIEKPDRMSVALNSSDLMMDNRAIRKCSTIAIEGPGGKLAIPFTVFIPANANQPVPLFLLINNRGPDAADPNRNVKSGFWPVEQIIERGYATAVFHVSHLDPDEHDGFQNGVHGVFDNKGERSGDAWGTIGAWAWGASRVLDALEQDQAVDANRVAVIGHSRGGKTALWAAAQDERFAMAISNNSGCTGAAISRQNQGEQIEAINERFPHWFAANYKRFNGKESELPIDQHMLLGLIAPRLLYVSSASADAWADPAGEYSSLCFAEEVYRLYGFQVQSAAEMPEIGMQVSTERTGYHLREGGHDLTEWDWQHFMDFADSRLRK
ncbi:S9 family peptidase [Paenibacillus sp. YN15]|uniref:alpha/beta hydrolase family protein n=1 Tax=Paenibacillus sp. YN15 TaxID=1742774 RepID=UPI00215C5155|nr:prolyl oligopeptidase family serine peptidase [Paenibacillus sp. YN15]